MREAQAILIKRRTKDGFFEVKDDVPLGRVYRVDLDSVGFYKYYSLEYYVHFIEKMIYDLDEKELIPYEMLKIKK